MKLSFFILFFIGFSWNSFAQKDSSYYNPNIVQKMYYLKPLQKANGSYYYGERRLNGYYALEVPFFELNDAEVNYHYQQFKTFNIIGQVISFVPTVYVIANINKPRTNLNNYLSILLGSLGASITCNIIGHSHIKKAAIKYNKALGQNNLGYFQLKPNDNSLGMALKYHF
jgi:hypothetical protein